MPRSSGTEVDVGLRARHTRTSVRARRYRGPVRGGSRRRRAQEMVPKQIATPMDRVPLQPLEGYTVGITADRRAAEQAELLRRRGARVLDGPTIATAYLGSDERLRRATEQVIAAPPDVLVITTGIGIRAWIAAAQSWGLDHALLVALSTG